MRVRLPDITDHCGSRLKLGSHGPTSTIVPGKAFGEMSSGGKTADTAALPRASEMTIMTAWGESAPDLLGEEPSENLNEERASTLPPEMIALLRGRPIGLVYTAGLDMGLEQLRSAVERLGLTAEVHVQLAQTSLPTLDREVRAALNDDDLLESFISYCRSAGDQLLMLPDRDSSWRTERQLGYGNLGLLVVSAYNTPTAALTGLWARGTVDGLDWLPLFPRRAKR